MPELGVYLAKMGERQRKLVREALAPMHGADPPHALVAVIDALVGFDAWQSLTAENKLSPDDAAEAAVDALMAILAASRPRALRQRAGGKPGIGARSRQ